MTLTFTRDLTNDIELIYFLPAVSCVLHLFALHAVDFTLSDCKMNKDDATFYQSVCIWVTEHCKNEQADLCLTFTIVLYIIMKVKANNLSLSSSYLLRGYIRKF